MSDLYLELSDLGVTLDLRHMGLSPEVIASAREALFGALDEMDALEAGARANGSEDRQVGHYWLRDPDLAPGELSSCSVFEPHTRTIGTLRYSPIRVKNAAQRQKSSSGRAHQKLTSACSCPG